MFKKKIIAGMGALVGFATAATIVLAAPGDPVGPGSITPPGPAGTGCGGIGVAFDGAIIWYNCALETKLRKTDLTGADLGFIDLLEGGSPVYVDAIAWDPNEGKIWGGALVDTDGAGGNDTCRIYKIDPATGATSTEFSYVDVHGGCDFFFYDGLTIDPATDTLWASPDVHSHIHHYTKAGVEIAADLIDFISLTPAGEPDVNSGLAMGLDGTLFAGTNGFGKIVHLDPLTPAFLGVFATVSGRDEDLECGPEVEGKETILSRDLFFPGRIDVLEAPEGTCISPTDDEPPVVACTESVNPHGTKIPPAGKSTPPGTNPNSGVNEDGYYHLGATDNSGLPVDIFVTNVSGTFTAGPYPSSTTVKVTEAKGATPSSKKIGSSTGAAGAVTAHITLDSDALVYGVDAAGNKSDPITCLVPPPPK